MQLPTGIGSHTQRHIKIYTLASGHYIASQKITLTKNKQYQLTSIAITAQNFANPTTL
jgi:hypothetical protein